jgi:hypothetical protein
MKKIFLVLFVLFWASLAFADFYVWTDDSGNRHYTDNEKNIPEKYRTQAKAPSLQNPIVQSDYGGTPPSAKATPATPEEPAGQLYGGKPIRYWVHEMNQMESNLIEAQNTVTLLENEVESLKHIKIGQVRRNPIIGKYYSRPVGNDSSLYYVDDNEKKLLQMKLEQVQTEVKSIEQELQIFRDDAKKAGVPPKYL